MRSGAVGQLLVHTSSLNCSRNVGYNVTTTMTTKLIHSIKIVAGVPTTIRKLKLLCNHPLYLKRRAGVYINQPLASPTHVPDLYAPRKRFGPDHTCQRTTGRNHSFIILSRTVRRVRTRCHRFGTLANHRPDCFRKRTITDTGFFRKLRVITRQRNLPCFTVNHPNRTMAFHRAGICTCVPESFGTCRASPFANMRSTITGTRRNKYSLVIFRPNCVSTCLLSRSDVAAAHLQRASVLYQPRMHT